MQVLGVETSCDETSAAMLNGRGDDATITAILNSTEPFLRRPLGLSEVELHQLVVFLQSLTDPAARDLSGLVPASVPSGLPVR